MYIYKYRLFGDDVSGLVELEGDEPPDPPCLFCGCQAKPQVTLNCILKVVFAKNERGYRLNAIKKRF